MGQTVTKNKIESAINNQRSEHSITDVVKIEPEELVNVVEFLKHYGIPGMRWGVRRYRGSNGRIVEGKYVAPDTAARLRKEGGSTPTVTSPNAAPKTSTEHQQARDLRQTPISQMSNQQLQAYVQRMNLERSYKEIASKDISTGKKFMNALLREAGNIGKDLVRDIAKNKIREIAVAQGLLPKKAKK